MFTRPHSCSYRGLPKLSPRGLNFGKGGKPLTSARGGLDFGNLPLPKSYIVFPNSDLCRPLLRRQLGSALPRSLALTLSPLLSSRDAAVGASAAIECAVVHVVTRLDAQDDLDGECDDRQ